MYVNKITLLLEASARAGKELFFHICKNGLSTKLGLIAKLFHSHFLNEKIVRNTSGFLAINAVVFGKVFYDQLPCFVAAHVEITIVEIIGCFEAVLNTDSTWALV